MGRHEAEPKNKGRRRAGTLLPAALAFMLVLGSVAFADNVQNNVTVGGNDTFTLGGSTNISYRIQANSGDGQAGCNASDGSPAVVTINTPAGVTASPNPLSFSACGSFLPTTFTASAAGNYAITVSVSDPGAGTYNTTPANFTLKVLAPSDSTPPVITANVSGTLGNNGWYVSDVDVSWTVTDPESAVTPSFGCDPVTIDSDTAGQTLTCEATSSGGTSSQSVTIKRDATPPVLSPTVSPNPVVLGESATATPNASDSMSGIASANCDAVDTSSVGTHTVNCTAMDLAGNPNSAAASYRVIYDFAGFFRPVDNLPVINVVKAGSAVPVKFSLSGNQGMDIFASGYPGTVVSGCNGTTDPIEETVTAGSSSLAYDPLTDQYTYVWKTHKMWAGSCRQLLVKFADGETYKANFSFK